MGRATVTGQLVLLCGKSFSGKSTIGSALADVLSAAVVSLDAINAERGLWGGAGIPVSEWARTNDIAHERVRTQLGAGKTVIVDDTSFPRFLRDGWRAEAKAVGAAMALVFVDTSDELRRQWLQKNRSHQYRGDVTDEVMAAHEDSFERPGEDEHFIRAQPGPASLEDLVLAVRRALSRSC